MIQQLYARLSGWAKRTSEPVPIPRMGSESELRPRLQGLPTMLRFNRQGQLTPSSATMPFTVLLCPRKLPAALPRRSSAPHLSPRLPGSMDVTRGGGLADSNT